MNPLYLAALAALVVLPAHSQQGAYRIAGTVVDGSSGRPLARIRLGLASTRARDREVTAVTGPDGRFRFDGLEAGKYDLTADQPNGVRIPYGQTSSFPISIVTGAGLHSENIVFRLFPPAAIHGRVTDPEGDPIEDALVQLFRSAVVRGQSRVFYYRSHRTNDLGEYRFGSLPVGTYYILATGRPWYSARVGLGDDTPELSRLSYAPTFYPNALEARAAAPLRVRGGEDVAADLSMNLLPASKLAIAIGSPDAAQPVETPGHRILRRQGPAVRVDVTFEGPNNSMGWERVETAFGQAELPGIPPGKYTVRVSTSDPAKPLYGRESVVVGAAETRMQVALAPPPTVTGKLRMEGSDLAVPRGTLIELENDVENRHIRRPIAADGSFSFEGLPPGEYTPLLMSPTAPIRLQTVALEGIASKSLWVEIDRSAQLDLKAVAKAGEVSGYVYRRGEAQPGVLVVLAPQDDSSNPYDYLAFQTDSDGSFVLTGVTAGDYILFAVEDFADFEYANPAAVRPHLSSGQRVRVDNNQALTVSLQLPD